MVVRLAYVSQRWERTNVNQGMTLGSYSSERATNLCIVSVWHVMNRRLCLIACCVWYNMVLYDIIQQHFLRNAIMHNNTFGIIQCQLVSLINFSHCLWGFHFQSGKPTWHGHGICQQPFFILFSILVVSSGSLSLKLLQYTIGISNAIYASARSLSLMMFKQTHTHKCKDLWWKQTTQ